MTAARGECTARGVPRAKICLSEAPVDEARNGFEDHTMIARRDLLAAGVAAALLTPALAQAAPLRELRIGYQKNGILVVAKQQRAIESRLKPLGVEVKWIEFSFGPPLLEALNVGSSTSAPPATRRRSSPRPPGANLLYVAAQPAAGSGAAILLPQGSPDPKPGRPQGQAGRLRQGVERPQPHGRRAGEGRALLQGHPAAHPRPRRRRRRLRARQRRRLDHLGPLLRHRGEAAGRAGPHPRQGRHPPELLLPRQPRLHGATRDGGAGGDRGARDGGGLVAGQPGGGGAKLLAEARASSSRRPARRGSHRLLDRARERRGGRPSSSASPTASTPSA